MKNELKISTVSIVCVLCASVASGAYGASSVRSLGGTGTYTSAASAARSGTSTGVARAGSVRITPTSVKANSAKPSGGASVTAGRVAASPRLSLGKYLGGKTSVSGGSSTRPTPGGSGGGTTDPGLAAELNNRVNVLEDNVADLKTSSEDLLANKQDKLTGDDYIEIDDNGNVSLIVDNLKQDLTGIDGADGREVAIGTSTDGKYIVWQYEGDSNWQQLIAIDDLVGPQGEKGEKGEPGDAANLDQYSTTAQMNQAISDAVKNFVTPQSLGEMLADFPTNEQVAATYATKEDLAGVETGAGSALTETLKGYAKNTDIENVERTTNLTQTISGADTASASKYTSEKAVADALAGKADASAVTTLSETVTNVSNVTNNFDTRMTELTTTVENNMQELETELSGVNTTINKITNDQGQVVNIAPNSITNVELKDGSVTNVKLADGAVTKARLADDVKNELVGQAEGSDPDGMYVLLVSPSGERVWADLTADAGEPVPDSGTPDTLPQ